MLQLLFNGIYLGGDPSTTLRDDVVKSVVPADSRLQQSAEGSRWSNAQHFDRGNRRRELIVTIEKEFVTVRDAFDFVIRYTPGDSHLFEGTGILRLPFTGEALLDTGGAPLLTTDGAPLHDTSGDHAWAWVFYNAILSQPTFTPLVGARVVIQYRLLSETVSLITDDAIPMWSVSPNDRVAVLYLEGDSDVWTQTVGKLTYTSGSDSLFTLTGDKITFV